MVEPTCEPLRAPNSFVIGTVPIVGDVALAPMAGYSDSPFRRICRELGSAMSFTPCTLDDAVPGNSPRTRSLLTFSPDERPLAVQMLGRDPDQLLAACRLVMAHTPDIIDLNLGCPARRVSSGGRGAALLGDLRRIGQIVARLTGALPVPITAKIRLGWDQDARNYLEVARILEDNGISAIAVHARTRAQGYSGNADWHAIGEVKQSVSVPVWGNGDVHTAADIAALRDQTGCDGVLIGRAAIGHPWIFRRRDPSEVTWDERSAMMRRHLAAMIAHYGERIGLILFRKHAVHYVQQLVGAGALRSRLVAASSPDEFMATLECWEPESLSGVSDDSSTAPQA